MKVTDLVTKLRAFRPVGTKITGFPQLLLSKSELDRLAGLAEPGICALGNLSYMCANVSQALATSKSGMQPSETVARRACSS